MKTLQQFIQITKLNRSNYPTKRTLLTEISKYEISRNLKIDILTYFLY